MDNNFFKHLLSFYSFSGTAIGPGVTKIGLLPLKSTQSSGRDIMWQIIQHSIVSIIIETQNL